MSKLSRLIGMASKALDKNSSSPASGGSGAPSDWRSMVRSAADAITGDGRDRPDAGYRAPAAGSASAWSPASVPPVARGYAPPPAGAGNTDVSSRDRSAIARYDYLLQTADPHQVEQIHRDAFARLTPEQRAHVEARMRSELPAAERPRSSGTDELARAATRSEMSRPGSVRALLARVGGGSRGRTGMVGGAALGAAGGVLAAVAGGAIVSSVAGPLLAGAANIDFDALGAGLDLDAIAGGVEGAAGDAVSGFGEHVSGFGEQFGGFELPGLGNFFDR